MAIRIAAYSSLFLVYVFGAEAFAVDFPPMTKRIADCENQWVLHEHNKSEELRALGYVYVDPTAGFTIEAHGDVELADGALTRLANQLEGKARLIIRVENNNSVACLSDEQIEQLGLSREWEFRDNYKDNRPAGVHYTAWASHSNHIGAFENALNQIKLARAENYSAANLEFEHGFALNALERCQDAAELLEAAKRRYKSDVEITAELAYAHLCLGQYPRAIEIYIQALNEDKQRTSTRRAEFAQNIAHAYNRLGDEKKSAEWRLKANEWKRRTD